MCARCQGPLPRHPEWLRRDGERIEFCGWKCAVLSREDDEARRIAEFYGWKEPTT